MSAEPAFEGGPGALMLGQRVAAIDAAGFVGREAEVDVIRALLEPDARRSVLLVSGEDGIGKSALLRVAERLAAAAGREVVRIDGRLVAGQPEVLDATLADAAGRTAPLVVLDAFEHLAPLEAHLRAEALPRLPADARVIIAGRRPPTPGWSRSGWEHVTVALTLDRLDEGAALALLAQRGVVEPRAARELIGWAEGLPLALTVASAAHASPGGPHGLDQQLARALLAQVIDDEVGDGARDGLMLAAIAPTVDAPMLRAILRDPEPDRTMRHLRGLSFVDGAGDRVRLQERLRWALAAQLAERDPHRAVEIRLRVADHLHDRALTGEPHLAFELRLLLDDVWVRWGIGEPEGPEVHADELRPGDEEALRAGLGAEDEAWWRRAVRWLREGQEHVIVLRDADRRVVGAGMWATPLSHPAWAAEDPVLGPVLEHAAVHVPDGNAMMLVETFDLLGAPPGGVSPVASVGNAALFARCGLPNARASYSAIPLDEQSTAFLGAMGYSAVPELDVELGGRRFPCHVLDHGPGGVIGTVRALVYRSCGVAPGPPAHRGAVDEALRAFHDPVVLAANPLATGEGIELRAASVQQLVRSALDAAFGPGEDDQLTRAALEHGYLTSGATHPKAAAALFLSRSSYFRRLASGRLRLGEVVLASWRVRPMTVDEPPS